MNSYERRLEANKVYNFEYWSEKHNKRDISTLESLGFEIVNPDKEELSRRYQNEGMNVFLQAVADCQALAFRSTVNMGITAGVVAEIQKAQELGLPVFELPTLFSNRFLSVEDTRAYLSYSGQR